MFAAVPYDTKEWVGNQSDKFFDLVALEKDDFEVINGDPGLYVPS